MALVFTDWENYTDTETAESFVCDFSTDRSSVGRLPLPFGYGAEFEALRQGIRERVVMHRGPYRDNWNSPTDVGAGDWQGLRQKLYRQGRHGGIFLYDFETYGIGQVRPENFVDVYNYSTSSFPETRAGGGSWVQRNGGFYGDWHAQIAADFGITTFFHCLPTNRPSLWSLRSEYLYQFKQILNHNTHIRVPTFYNNGDCVIVGEYLSYIGDPVQFAETFGAFVTVAVDWWEGYEVLSPLPQSPAYIATQTAEFGPSNPIPIYDDATAAVLRFNVPGGFTFQ